jgi:hypothetical protein
MISRVILLYTGPKWAVLRQNGVVLVGAWQKWCTNLCGARTREVRYKHFNLLSNTISIDKDSNLEDNSNLESSSFNTSTTNNTLNSYFKNSNLRKRPSFILFSKEEYKNNLLAFIISNNLPFSIT